MVLNLQIIKLQEVISLILEENFVKTDADYEAAAAIIQSFTSHIDAIETFRRLYQSQSNVEGHSVKKTNDDSSLGSCLFGIFKDIVIYLSILGINYHCREKNDVNLYHF